MTKIIKHLCSPTRLFLAGNSFPPLPRTRLADLHVEVRAIKVVRIKLMMSLGHVDNMSIKSSIELLTPKMSMVSEDWENRQMVNVIVNAIGKMTTILNKFGKKRGFVLPRCDHNHLLLLFFSQS